MEVSPTQTIYLSEATTGFSSTSILSSVLSSLLSQFLLVLLSLKFPPNTPDREHESPTVGAQCFSLFL